MKLKFVLFCFMAALTMHAQGNSEITGRVIEKTTGAAIPYASVVVKEDGKVKTGAITDESGNFSVNKLESKNYAVEIQYMGFKTYAASANLTSVKNLALGAISLEEDALQLNEVNVIAERSTIEQKIDRKVINVGKDLTTAGATASEIMNNIPSVNIDQDGNISLRGNTNVRILVDGRPTTMDAAQLLKTIPSTSIKKIELITNPSAKYNPEGMSGIINIVLHKNANDGFNASINAGVTFGEKPKFNSSTNMNYRRGRFNFFGTYGNNLAKYVNGADITRGIDDSRELVDVRNDVNGNIFKIGMDFYINDRNTISAYTNQNIFNGGVDIYTNVYSPVAADRLFQQAEYLNENHDATYNLAYKKLFEKEGETLDIEINHNQSIGEQRSTFRNEYEIPGQDFAYDDRLDDEMNQTTVNADYVNPISEKSRIEFGAEARLLRTDNDYDTNNANLVDSKYNYDLDIYSAYATFGQKFEKISYQLGARFESYKVTATLDGNEVYKDDYLTVYPSASMTYSPTEKNMFQLSYSRRVDRPGINQTKPIREFSTPRLTAFGNPELDPQFTNSLEVNYTRTLEKGSISGGIFVRDIRNEINRVIYPDPENDTRQIMTFDNFDNNTAFGFELSANYKITSWWDVQPAIDYSNISQKGLVSILNTGSGEYEFRSKEVDVAQFNARLNSNFKATKQLSFLLFGFYRGPFDGIQFNPKEMYKIDAGARYSFLDSKATLSLRLNDIFDTNEFRMEGDNPYPQRGRFTWESRTLYVGFNYTFGAGKNRELQRKQREDNTKQGGGMF